MEPTQSFNAFSSIYASNTGISSNTTAQPVVSSSAPAPMAADSANITTYPTPPVPAEEKPGLMSRFTKWLAKVTFEPLMNLFFRVFRPS